MMEGADYNSMASNRPNNDDQQQTQQQQQQQDLRRNRKADYRFLIPSRDAGGSFETKKKNFHSRIFFSFHFQPSLAKVEKLFKIFD